MISAKNLPQLDSIKFHSSQSEGLGLATSAAVHLSSLIYPPPPFPNQRESFWPPLALSLSGFFLSCLFTSSSSKQRRSRQQSHQKSHVQSPDPPPPCKYVLEEACLYRSVNPPFNCSALMFIEEDYLHIYMRACGAIRHYGIRFLCADMRADPSPSPGLFSKSVL